MRQRTKRLPTSKGVVYIVLALLLAGGKHIYNNYIAPEGEQELTTVINTEPTSPKSEEKITLDNESKPQKSKDKRKVNRSGWAELPAERRNDDLYYAYHTVAEDCNVSHIVDTIRLRRIVPQSRPFLFLSSLWFILLFAITLSYRSTQNKTMIVYHITV